MKRLDEVLPRSLFRPSGRIHEQRFTPEAGGLFSVTEVAPEGLFEHLRDTWAADGYLFGAACSRFAYGMGCGHIVALLEAFPGTPRGMIVADLDLAVVCAWEMLLDCVARQSDPIAFAREFLGGEEETWRNLEERVLSRRSALGLPLPGESERERLWDGLRLLREHCVDAADAARRVEEWRAAVPRAGESVLFWTSLFRVYDKLHTLANEGRVAVLQASLFDPDLSKSLKELPGFTDSVHAIYLSNAADTEARRVLFASGRSRLGLSHEDVDLGRTPEFVAHLNAELRRMNVLASISRGVFFVHTSETLNEVLTVETEAPQYDAGDFFLQIDLDRVALMLFESPEEEGPEISGPWRRARAFRRANLALYGATVRRDEKAASAALEGLIRELTAQPLVPCEEPVYLAFRIAALAESLLMIRRGVMAAALSRELAILEDAVRDGLRHLEGAGEQSLLESVPTWGLFLHAHAFTGGGRVLDEPSWIALGRRLADAGLELGGDQVDLLAFRVQALLHLLACDIHDSRPALQRAVREGVARLMSELRATWEVGIVPEDFPGGLAAYAQAPDVSWQGLRLLFLFHGLRSEDLDPIRAVFLLRRRDVSVPVAGEVTR